MAYNTIIVEVEDQIATIRLNRPDALNALNAELLSELAQAVTELEADSRIRCTILTGSDKAFAAGADITEMADLNFVDGVSTD